MSGLTSNPHFKNVDEILEDPHGAMAEVEQLRTENRLLREAAESAILAHTRIALREPLRAAAETPEPYPPGTEVVLRESTWVGQPREGWVVETRDFPRPLMYRIRHPNGSLLDVVPDYISRRASERAAEPREVLEDVYRALCVAWDNQALPATVLSAQQFTAMREALGIPFPGYARPGLRPEKTGSPP